MFITQKRLPRRTVLKGLGAAVALPFLEAMVPARAALAQTAASPAKRLRLVAMEMVHGAAGSTNFGAKNHLWSPAEVGTGFDLSPTGVQASIAIMSPID